MKCDVKAGARGAPPEARVRTLLTRVARMTRAEVAGATGSESARMTRARVARATGFADSRAVDGGAEVSVLFCGDARMRSLNARYRRKDKSTDVLAFPSSLPGNLLGDIVVSVPYATRQARRRGEPVCREIDRLLVHGFLHLLGYDHETDEGEMDALEARIRRRLSIADPA